MPYRPTYARVSYTYDGTHARTAGFNNAFLRDEQVAALYVESLIHRVRFESTRGCRWLFARHPTPATRRVAGGPSTRQVGSQPDRWALKPGRWALNPTGGLSTRQVGSQTQQVGSQPGRWALNPTGGLSTRQVGSQTRQVGSQPGRWALNPTGGLSTRQVGSQPDRWALNPAGGLSTRQVGSQPGRWALNPTGGLSIRGRTEKKTQTFPHDLRSAQRVSKRRRCKFEQPTLKTINS